MDKAIFEANKILGTNFEDWETLSKYRELTEDFIREFQDKVDWYTVSFHQTLSEDFIREFQDKVNWGHVSFHQTLSEDFIREFQDKVDWQCISEYQLISEEFICEFQDRVDWECVSRCQTLSEHFIREFQDEVDWQCISRYQTLSRDFIREFQDKIYWSDFSFFKTLSEDFIREFQDKVDWREVSSIQFLSKDFIREFRDKVYWPYILKRQCISSEFFKSDEIRQVLAITDAQVKELELLGRICEPVKLHGTETYMISMDNDTHSIIGYPVQDALEDLQRNNNNVFRYDLDGVHYEYPLDDKQVDCIIEGGGVWLGGKNDPEHRPLVHVYFDIVDKQLKQGKDIREALKEDNLKKLKEIKEQAPKNTQAQKESKSLKI